MSFARFSEDSDVYVFLDVNGFFSCCACILVEHSSVKCMSTSAMLEHLEEHKEAGHKVPDRTIARLMTEQTKNDEFITSFDGRLE